MVDPVSDFLLGSTILNEEGTVLGLGLGKETGVAVSPLLGAIQGDGAVPFCTVK